MTLLEYDLQFVSEICEGRRPAPQGYVLPEGGEDEKAVALQRQILETGIAAFVKACADEAGLVIPQEEYDGFDESALLAALGQLPELARQAPQEPAQEPPQEPVRSEVRDIYEVFLDSVCLDDGLVQYLIDIAKRGDQEAFATLSHAAARTILDLGDFLAWLGNKELLAPPEERACAALLDGCLDRLAREGKRELLAALLSGDETTFRAFRCEAPELMHRPEATFGWFTQNYLDRYYPVRFLMKYNGVVFPKASVPSSSD